MPAHQPARYSGHCRFGLRSFTAAMPVWIKEKLMLKRLLLEELGKIAGGPVPEAKLLFPEHHRWLRNPGKKMVRL